MESVREREPPVLVAVLVVVLDTVLEMEGENVADRAKVSLRVADADRDAVELSENDGLGVEDLVPLGVIVLVHDAVAEAERDF